MAKQPESFDALLYKLVMKHIKKEGANGIAYILVNHAVKMAYANEPSTGMAHYLICRAIQDGIENATGQTDECPECKKAETNHD